MRKNQVEAFLETYKKLEETLRESNRAKSSVIDFEYEVQDERPQEQRKLQLCRLCRNYLQHNTDKFVVPTAEMTAFLKKIIAEVKTEDGYAKDIMSRVSAVNWNGKISDAVNSFTKDREFVPVVDDDNKYIGMVTVNTLILTVQAAGLNKKLKSLRDLMDTGDVYPAIAGKTPISELDEKTTYVVANNEKYRGIILGGNR